MSISPPKQHENGLLEDEIRWDPQNGGRHKLAQNVVGSARSVVLGRLSLALACPLCDGIDRRYGLC